MNLTKTLLVAAAAATALSMTTPERKTTIFMIGDSTMANKSLDYGNPERGWGQMLPAFFTPDIAVDNHAVNGRSSKSFIDEGRWQTVLDKIQPGDYVFIQFGHNDEKADPERHTDPGTTFDENLSRFVRETRSKGGKPVLFNSIVRRIFGHDPNAVANDDTRTSSATAETDTLTDTHGDYLLSPRNVAEKMDVPFIDLNKITHDLVQGLGNEESKRLYVWVEPGTCPKCPDGRQDNTHLNVRGARIVAGLAADAVAKAVPELAPFVRHYDYVVAKDGSGDFFTLQEAVDAVPDFRKCRTTILLRSGEYNEKIVVPTSKKNITLTGEDGAIITYADHVGKLNHLGDSISTSASGSCFIFGPNFHAENITFRNTAGRVGQAVACYVDADRVHFRRCRFIGNQDTFYTYGKTGRIYCEECYIEGTFDFIFGASTTFFDRCTIKSLDNGYIAAPSTPKGRDYGYVFSDCNIIAAEGVDSVWLARPWRPYAKAVFVRCHMDSHIVPEGWDDWDKPEAHATIHFAEFESRGHGASAKTRAKFSTQLRHPDDYTLQKVLGGKEGWNPGEWEF